MKTNMKPIGNPKNIKVLMYHLITKDKKFSIEHKDIAVHIDDFRSQLDILNRLGYTTITFRDYKLFLEKKLNLPRKPIILTFDDGFETMYTDVFPLMQSYGMTGVLFILADKETKFSMWDFPEIEPLPLLKEEQIIEMNEAGFEIGAHTISHPNLTKISRDDAWNEISRSRMLLEIMLGTEIISFAYTYGILNNVIKELVKEAGYKFACSTYTGPSTINKDHYEIRRTLIRGNTGLLRYLIKLLKPYSYLETLWWKIKSISNYDRNSY